MTLVTPPSGLLCPAHFRFRRRVIARRPNAGFREGPRRGCGSGWRRVVAAGGRRQAAGDGRGASPPRRPRLHPGLGSAMESGGRPSLGQFILLGTSSVVTAVLYSVYRQKAQVAQELKVSAGALLASAGPLAQGNGEPLIRHGPHHPRKRSKRGNRL